MQYEDDPQKPISGWRYRIHEVIFEADTPSGKVFDVALLVFILISIVATMLESVEWINERYSSVLLAVEWAVTIAFTIEYLLRIVSIAKPWRYMISFYGIIDLLSTLPTYLSLFLVGTRYFAILRILRLMRIFRVFKLSRYLTEGTQLVNALKASRPKITVFLAAVVMVTVLVGSTMYVIEKEHGGGFDSIPESIYWAIVTMTTVGYGDITPETALGKFLASIMMIMGYGIIAVPTGIVSAEMIQANKEEKTNTQACLYCGGEDHRLDSKYCRHCGERMIF